MIINDSKRLQFWKKPWKKGKVMLDKVSTDNPIVLNISAWERGTYNVKILNEDTKETKVDKLILK